MAADSKQDKQKAMELANMEVNRLTGRVLDLEKELRQARSDERRARRELYALSVS